MSKKLKLFIDRIDGESKTNNAQLEVCSIISNNDFRATVTVTLAHPYVQNLHGGGSHHGDPGDRSGAEPLPLQRHEPEPVVRCIKSILCMILHHQFYA
jgi:hypothetical protein